jgi:hypothetical protein
MFRLNFRLESEAVEEAGTMLESPAGMRSNILASAAVTLLAVSAVADAEPYVAAFVSGPAVVRCGASQRAVVRHIWVDGRRAARVTCVGVARRTAVVHRRVARHRSWKKTALVIGGSTAAGAGVGALVGGKKGALIGAAAGGAAGTAYEVHKRRKHRRYR